MCVSFIILFLTMWVFAAFGEEFLFGGYYMKHFAEFLGDTNKSQGISTIILSIYFGVSHNYQETTDLKSVGCISRAGSSPTPCTRRESLLTVGFFVIYNIFLYILKRNKFR